MINKILKYKYVPLVTRILGLFFFLILLIMLFYGSVKVLGYNFNSKLAMFLVWTLWWPLLYIILFLFARMWCGVLCPVSLGNEAGNYLRKGKNINVLKWGFVAYVVFFLVVYIEQVSGLFLSVSMTILFFVLFLGSALLVGLFLKRWSFCRLLCPIGTLLGVFSRLSVIGLRTDRDKCNKCITKECILGGRVEPCPMYNNVPSIGSNVNCLVCGNCIKNCPHDSARVRFIKPGAEILDKKEFKISESLFIISLFSLTSILTTNGNLMLRGLFNLSLSGYLLRGMDFILSLILFIGIFFIVSYVSSRLLGIKYKNGLREFGYYYLPLVFFIMFFTIVFGFLGPVINIDDVSYFKYFFLVAGFVWSILVMYKGIYLEHKKFFGVVPHYVFILGIFLIWLLVFINGPLNVIGEGSSVVVSEGEAVNIDAFSMGFNPSTIIVNKGDVVRLNITNKDIIHAFDIDEYNIHTKIKGGKNIELMFSADKEGEFRFYCSVPGHTEAGMKGKLIVKDLK